MSSPGEKRQQSDEGNFLGESSSKKPKTVQDEDPKNRPITAQEFPSKVKELIKKFKNVIKELGPSASSASQYLQEIEGIEGEIDDIGFRELQVVTVGDTGYGKSTFIRFLLEKTELLSLIEASSSAQSVTKFPLKVSFQKCSAVEVHFMTKELLEKFESNQTKSEADESEENQLERFTPEEKIKEYALKNKWKYLEPNEDEEKVPGIRIENFNETLLANETRKVVAHFTGEHILYLDVQGKFSSLSEEKNGFPISLWDTPGLNEQSLLETKKAAWIYAQADVLLPVFKMRTDPMIRYLVNLIGRFALSHQIGSPQMIPIMSSTEGPFQIEKPWEFVNVKGKPFSAIDHFRPLLKGLKNFESPEYPDYLLQQRLDVKEDLEKTLAAFTFFKLNQSAEIPANLKAKDQFFKQLRIAWEQKIAWHLRKAMPFARACLLDLKKIQKRRPSAMIVIKVDDRVKVHFEKHFFPKELDLLNYISNEADFGDSRDPESFQRYVGKHVGELFGKSRLRHAARDSLFQALSFVDQLSKRDLARKASVCFNIVDYLVDGTPLEADADALMKVHEDKINSFLIESSMTVVQAFGGDDQQRDFAESLKERIFFIMIEECKRATTEIKNHYSKAVNSLRLPAFLNGDPKVTPAMIFGEILIRTQLLRKKTQAYTQGLKLLFGHGPSYLGSVERNLLDPMVLNSTMKTSDQYETIVGDIEKLVARMVKQIPENHGLIQRSNLGNKDDSFMKRASEPKLYSRVTEEKKKRTIEKLEKNLKPEKSVKYLKQLENLNEKLSRIATFPNWPEKESRNCEYIFLEGDGKEGLKDVIPVFFRIQDHPPDGKVIQVEFHKEKSFQVKIPRSLLHQLKENLQCVEKSFLDLFDSPETKRKAESVDWIYPIFIFSKGRHGRGTSKITAHLPIAPREGTSFFNGAFPASPSNQMKSNTLVFLGVEQEELADYMETFRNYQEDQLYFISIPGKNRGTAFAREMIKMVQHLLDHLLKERDSSLPFYFILDDDVMKTNVYDPETQQMRPCSLELGLSFAQLTLQKEISLADSRIELLGLLSEIETEEQIDAICEGMSDFFIKVPRSSFLRESLKGLPFRNALLRAADRGENFLIECLLSRLSQPSRNGAKVSLDPEKVRVWGNEFGRRLAEVKSKSVLKLASVAISNAGFSFEGNNYNYKLPQATHRISNEISKAVLFHSQAVKGFGYLDRSNLFLSQNEVDLLQNSTPTTGNKLEKEFLSLLTSNGRANISVYLYSIRFYRR